MSGAAFGQQSMSARRMRWGVVAWLCAIVAPVILVSAVLVAFDAPPRELTTACLATGIGATLLLGGLAARRLVVTLDTVSDLLGAMREGDFAFRGSVGSGIDPLRGLIANANLLGDDLRESRRKRTETSRFLGKTLIALKDPVFVVDEADRLRLVNPAGRRLLGAERTSLVGRDLATLELGDALNAPDNAVISGRFTGGHGKWAVRRAVWYSEGREHRLIMLRDLSVALADEERHAWQRLLRVLSHELNNSLAPIASLAGSLSTMIAPAVAGGSSDEMRLGLEVIGRRADSLTRFLDGYGKLARLPPLRVAPFRLDHCLARLAVLETRMRIVVMGTAEVMLHGDEDQLSQAFINLLRNAVEAALPVGGGVRVDWTADDRFIHVTIEDDGVGLPDSDTLFVPFFTTKPDGSGIGLSLVRLIVESHAGAVDLQRRPGARGALAVVRLPRESCR